MPRLRIKHVIYILDAVVTAEGAVEEVLHLLIMFEHPLPSGRQRVHIVPQRGDSVLGASVLPQREQVPSKRYPNDQHHPPPHATQCRVCHHLPHRHTPHDQQRGGDGQDVAQMGGICDDGEAGNEHRPHAHKAHPQRHEGTLIRPPRPPAIRHRQHAQQPPHAPQRIAHRADILGKAREANGGKPTTLFECFAFGVIQRSRPMPKQQPQRTRQSNPPVCQHHPHSLTRLAHHPQQRHPTIQHQHAGGGVLGVDGKDHPDEAPVQETRRIILERSNRAISHPRHQQIRQRIGQGEVVMGHDYRRNCPCQPSQPPRPASAQAVSG